MALTDTDELRLRVLLAQNPLAIKVNESSMILYALIGKENGYEEARVELHADREPGKYLKHLREFLSVQILGSRGAYPLYLSRWARMGQLRAKNLDRLLLLGEEEAVTAVVHAENLSVKLARGAWWALPDAGNARQLLKQRTIAESQLGIELSAFLLEFLPFEQDQQAMIDSVSVVLRSAIADRETRQGLWRKAARRPAYYVGFLQALADDIPMDMAAHPGLADLQSFRSEHPIDENSELLALLEKILNSGGQAYLFTLKKAFEKPNNQDVVISILNTIGKYFNALNPENRRYRDLAMWNRHAGEILQRRYTALVTAMPAHMASYCRSLMALSMVDETMVDPVFALTDSVGSVMRKRVKPVTDAVLIHIDALLASP